MFSMIYFFVISLRNILLLIQQTHNSFCLIVLGVNVNILCIILYNDTYSIHKYFAFLLKGV